MFHGQTAYHPPKLLQLFKLPDYKVFQPPPLSLAELNQNLQPFAKIDMSFFQLTLKKLGR